MVEISATDKLSSSSIVGRSGGGKETAIRTCFCKNSFEKMEVRI
jgi:ABC-type polar amino acid transport system ATPase subunit